MNAPPRERLGQRGRLPRDPRVGPGADSPQRFDGWREMDSGRLLAAELSARWRQRAIPKLPRVWCFANSPVHRVQRDFFLKYQKSRRGQLIIRDRFSMTTLVQRRV